MATAGLPSNTVNAIAHDQAGNTWLGTDWGLCKFDGSNWTVYQQGTSGLPENDVRALAVDGLGRLWIGLLSSGLVVFDGADWLQFTPVNSPMPAYQVKNIAIDAQGFAWLATTSGMARTDLTDWRVYNDTDESYNGLILPGLNIADIAVREDGLVCVGTLNAGFTYVTESSVVVYTNQQNGLPDNTALGVAVDANGDRWLACPSGGLLRNFGDFEGGFWSQYISQNSGIPSNALNDVAIDNAGRKVVASQIAGVGILTGINDWQTLNAQNSGLPDDDVRCVAVAMDNAIWAGTATGGAARIQPFVSVSALDKVQWRMRVYPVPATDQLFVEVPRTDIDDAAIWSVLDSRGGSVGTGLGWVYERKQMDISGLVPGVYMLRIVSKGRSSTARFVVE